MVDGKEILEMWGDLVTERLTSQVVTLQEQEEAARQLMARLQNNQFAQKLNPGLRFMDWDNAPAIAQDLHALPADVLGLATYWQATWHWYWQRQLELWVACWNPTRPR